MDAVRWQRLQELFAQALALPAPQREDFVRRMTGADAALADELRALLRQDGAGADPVQGVLSQAASGWLNERRHALIGQRLGPWRVVAHLADGGMGAVYRAERADGQFEQAAAIKLLNPALVSGEAVARLEAERQLLARLSHPLIARLLDGGRTDQGAPYLVMELVEGVPIDTWCDAQELAVPARLRLFMQVCEAVQFAHRNLVVHRDLKPANILVDADGRPRLLDFGIAKLLDADGSTRTGESLLTPSHASPEQIQGGPITTATDVYALGVLLYELLTGRLPHVPTAGHSIELARAIVETEPPRPSAAVLRAGGATAVPRSRELAGDLDNIVAMALRKDPARRYASAAEFATDIERYLAHRPVQARADTLAYRWSKFLRRHPVAVPVSALGVVLAGTAAAAFTWRLAEERDRALAAERSARRAASFTASLLKSTSADEGGARKISVRDLLDQAGVRVRDELKDEPEIAGRLQYALGHALSSWGANAEALTLLDAALATLRRQPGAQTEVAEVLSLLSVVTHDLGQLDVSLDWARQAEAAWRAVGSPAQQGVALHDVAVSLSGLSRRSEAEPVFREALERLRASHRGDHLSIAASLNELAWCLHAMGRLDEAAPLYEESAGMQRRLGAPATDVFQTLNNLAGLNFDRGELERAESLWREVLAIVTRLYGEGGHAAVARAHNAVALVLIERGRYAEAAEHTQRAVQINRDQVGEQHRWTATTMQSHGIALLGMNRAAEAEAQLQRSLAIRVAVLPPRHAERIGSHTGLARVAAARGDARRAEREWREALAIIDGLASPDRVQRDVVEWGLARAIAAQGRRDEALVLATRALERRRQAMPPTHPRRLAAEAGISLPPFVAAAAAADVAQARATLQVLRQRLGPQAAAVRELQEQIDAADG